MAIYEYICSKCEHVWEEMVSMDDRHVPTKGKCPNCKKKGQIDIKIGSKVGDPIALGVQGPSSSFKEIMRHHAKNTYKNKLDKWK